MNALNPVLTIRAQLQDVLATHQPDMSRKARQARCVELLTLVGVDPRRSRSYPTSCPAGCGNGS
ncbi:hypothetical protein [Phytohabitans houttuyneae]|nr:hypothetical protein [Phytohabitans houttuyneae]